MLFSSEAEPARGGEIERARISAQLSHHTGQITTAQPLFQREQRILRLVGRDMDQAALQPWRQAGAVGPPAQTDCSAILHPQHAAAVLGLLHRVAWGMAQRIARQGQRQPRPACRA